MNYTYVGYTEDRQIVKGKVSAVGEQAALDKLAHVGYRVVSLRSAATFLPNAGVLLRGRVKQSEMITFTRQLALLLESGVGIVQSLELLQSQTENKELKKVLIEVVSDLRGGGSLASALEKHPHIFPNVYSKLVSVGENTGGIEGVLRNLADYIERESGAIKKLKSALMYPFVVLGLGILISILLIVVVLPPIVNLFSSLGGDLPLPTRMLLASVDLLNNYGLLIFVAFAFLGLIGVIYTRTPSGRYVKDRVVLGLPVLGKISLLTELARCCRSLSLLFKAGLPLPDVMTLTAQASGNKVLTKALNEVEQDMLRGAGLASPMRKRWIFLPLMVEMAKVGEETGNLDEVLVTVAQNYEIEAESRVQTVLSMIEPTMTIVMGLGVGFLALSIFLPIYTSLSLVGG